MAGGVASLTQQQVQDMLERIGLGHLKPKFAENGVNGQDLLELTEDDYRESLGCTGLQVRPRFPSLKGQKIYVASNCSCLSHLDEKNQKGTRSNTIKRNG